MDTLLLAVAGLIVWCVVAYAVGLVVGKAIAHGEDRDDG